ncbi:MAG TPA: ATP-binding protein [Rhizomicrobium sp.]|jgi:hypothetical protein
MSVAQLKVTSHVARDLLQSAALFKHEHAVVWEYVSNGLEYVEAGKQSIVDVSVDAKSKKITIRDSARGMSRGDLHRYFQMHGENIDRKKGKPGRGMFGTGKSAAFGIGDLLRITTIRGGLRQKVELTRRAVEGSADGSGIPVRVLESDIKTHEPSGTIVEIEGIHLKKMDVGSIARHVERHIARWPNATVFVNRTQCKMTEPPYSSVRRSSTKGTAFEASLGIAELVLKVAKASLEPELQGVAIFSNGVWHANTLAGCEGRPFANYIFGEFDVLRLSQDESPIPAFDMSRSMQLNIRNEIVAQIYAFLGSQIQILRREIEKTDRDRRRERDVKRLTEEAHEIARIINRDFDEWRDHLHRTLARVQGGKDRLQKSNASEDSGDGLSPGSELPAIILEDESGERSTEYSPDDLPNDPTPNPDQPNEPGPSLAPSNDDEDKIAKRRNKSKTSGSGGFNVDFLNMGIEDARAKYERDVRTININLDHPQIAAALALDGIEDIAFRRLCYEVAFSEYAIALSSELAGGDWYHDITDPIVDIRDTINRISRSAAALYSKV